MINILRNFLHIFKKNYTFAHVKRTNMNRTNVYYESRNGVFSTKDIRNRNEYLRTLRAERRGDLIRVRQGVYAEPSSVISTMIDVEKIVPNGIVCLYNAWSYYELTTTVPPTFCIAIEAKRKVRTSNIFPITLYYWKKENLEFGTILKEISGYQVRITDLERSVCDAIKYRNKIGLDLCAEIVKTYLNKPERNLSLLSEYARKLRVSKVLDNYLEVLM